MDIPYISEERFYMHSSIKLKAFYSIRDTTTPLTLIPKEKPDERSKRVYFLIFMSVLFLLSLVLLGLLYILSALGSHGFHLLK